jgi:hypothetical protein
MSEAGAAGKGSRSGIHIENMNIHNPVREEAGESVTRAVTRASFLAGRQLG